MTPLDKFTVIVGASLAAWGGVILIVIAGLWLIGCDDKAYPLDCPNACGHRLD